MSDTLFKIGPFNICLWNIIFIGMIFLSASIFRRLLSRFLKRQLKNSNIVLEGQNLAYFRLFTQSVYLVALYFGVMSFQFNNEEITFAEFIKYDLISIGSLNLSLYNIILVVAIVFTSKIGISAYTLYITKKLQLRKGYEPGLEYVYIQIARYIIYVFAVFISLSVLGINLTLLLTGSVGLLVGIGLGLQDVFKDLIAGVVLLLEGNIKMGDIVEIHGGNDAKSSSTTVARILKINFRTTQIQTRAGNVLIIPNTKLTQQQVENWTHSSPLSMFTIPLTVGYGADTGLIQELLITAAKSHPKVVKSEPVFVRFLNFGENGIELEVVFWAANSWDIINFKSDIRFEIDRLFRMHQINIPYPTREILQKKRD